MMDEATPVGDSLDIGMPPNLKTEEQIEQERAARLAEGSVVKIKRHVPELYWAALVPPFLTPWVDGSGPKFATLWGSSFTGKTSALFACVAELIRHGRKYDVLFSRRLSIGAYKGYRLDGDMEQYLYKYQDARCLFIDDFGTEAYEQGRHIIAEIIDHRFQNCLPTLVTTNMDPRNTPGLEKRIAHRLCSGIVVEMKARS